jgi:hypothetical protein
MNMRERLGELMNELDTEVREIIGQVVRLERENMDAQKPRVREEIKDIISKRAWRSLKEEGRI